jgi:extracellular elastinolytic metalloproteinase
MYRKLTLLLLFALLNSALLFGQAKNPVATATDFMRANLEDLQLVESDITDMIVNNQVVSKHNKVTHIYFKQSHAGIPVHNAIFNINLLENGEVFHYGNRFERELAKRVNTTTPQISMEQAVANFMQQFNIPGETPQIVEQKDAMHATFDHRTIALEPIEVALVYQPTKSKAVRLAWNVTFYETNAQHWWNARVDAVTGQVIDFFDQVLHCEFDTPGCTDETHNHGAGAADYTPVPFVETTTSGDEATYRVFPLFIESPNHGDRTLEVNPADVVASPFGWHDINGEEGPEYTITRGNNVHAYHDIFNQNSSFGDEPDGGDSLCFDFPLDLSTNLPFTQLDPLVTNLFYWNNLVHDVWAYYGFDEAAGNFQETNYSGEGVGGDYVRAEALDGSGTNNANFATPPDGSNPRMQMYLWGGVLPNTDINTSLDIIEPSIIAGSYPHVPGGFGGQFPGDTLVGEVVLVNDGVDTTTDACDPIQNGADLDGKIAMIDRGNCQFGVKALAAEQQGCYCGDYL